MRIYEPYKTTSNAATSTRPFSPREEQRDAIEKAFTHFEKSAKKNKGAEFLWNAKMRFGKTFCALWLIEKLKNELACKKVLIVTHRPVVNAEWFKAYKQIFKDNLSEYSYGSSKENNDEANIKDFNDIKKDVSNGKCVLYFASLQYLRRAKEAGGKEDDPPKRDILRYDWDLVIADEAHEGFLTELGQGVTQCLQKNKTFMLYLSGTPFNLLEKFKSEQIYNWDYVKEQQYKREWQPTSEEDVNPYQELPQMEIYTFSMSDMTDEQLIKDAATRAFSFSEFFRVKTGHDVSPEERGKFVHEEQVLKFLMKMTETSDVSHYPFSNNEYRKCFRHTLWVVPGVKEAYALQKLIEEKTPFKKWGFKVINVAGRNDEDEKKSDALDQVLEAMCFDRNTDTDDSNQTRTITLSCARLTTGVTVRPWTAVLYMKGSETTNASTYMQTIFRVQSPHTINGMMKSKCYVFDFAPERALTMMAETAKYSRDFERKEMGKQKKQKAIIEQEDKEQMTKLLNECPIYEMPQGAPVINHGQMQPIETDKLFSKLNSVYTDKVVRNGFDHPSLYNYEEFLKLDLEDESNLNYINSIFGDEPRTNRDNDRDAIVVNKQDNLTPEQIAALEKERKEREEAAKKAREDAKKRYKDKLDAMPDEEREEFLRQKEEKARKLKLIHQSKDKLTGLSKRIPLMMYGANVEDFEDVTIENFTDKRFIDDDSWNEFMPKGVSRELFKKLSKFYNADVFRDAGIKIRQLALEADEFKVEERIARIAQIFKWFKNPDQETVLTPWEVVNRHMSNTLGGYCFFDEDFKTPCTKFDEKTGELLSTKEPRFVPQGDVTKQIFGDGKLGNIDELAGSIKTKILEINSKTGLYPLYIAYSLYRHLLPVYAKEKGLMADDPKDYSANDEHAIWDEVVKNNLYVICNTKMAERITRRTLLGFRKDKDNNEIKIHVKQDQLISRARENRESLINDMLNEGYWTNKKMKKNISFNAVVGNPPYQLGNRQQIYPTFYLISREVGDVVSMIFPTGWQQPKTANNLGILNNEEIKGDPQIIKIDNLHNVFNNIPGAEWVNILFWQRGYNNGLNGLQRVLTNGENEEIIKLLCSRDEIKKPEEIETLCKCVMEYKGEEGEKKDTKFVSLQTKTSVLKPYGLRTDVFVEFSKYGLPSLQAERREPTDVKVYGKSEAVMYIPKDYPLPGGKKPNQKYKVFVPYAWGNMCEREFLGGAFSNIIIGLPNEIVTETYQESGCFDTKEDAIKHAKYLLTRFARATLYKNKQSQHSTTAWGAVPVQDYHESWWDESIAQIENHLFDKYKVPEAVRQFVLTKFQEKTVENISNYNVLISHE